MQNVTMRIVLCVACVLLIAGTAVTGYMLLNLDSRDIIDVELNEQGSATVEFTSDGIKPGDTLEYVLAVDSELPGTCVLTLDFEEIKKGTLKDHLYVTVEVEGEVLCETLLSELLVSDEPLSTTVKVSKREAFEIKVRYALPLETGNEAKNASVDYLLNITLSNE